MSIDDPDSDPDPDRSPRPHLRVVVTDGRGRVRRADRLRRWLADVAPESACGEVVIALVGDRKMRDLNQRYRGVDRATDVLSFPVMSEAPPDAGIEPAAHAANDGDGADGRRAERAAPPEPFGGVEPHPGDIAGATGGPPAAGRARPPGEPHLGDIVIATGVARRQAQAAGHPLGTELRCLALHGLLHLLGYDRDTGQMERLERRLRRRGGLA